MRKSNIEDEDPINYKELIDESIARGKDADWEPLNFTQNDQIDIEEFM